VTTTVVKTFIRNNGARYSVRRRSDGLFQLYEDNVYSGLGYGYDDEPMSGIYADYETAETELLRGCSDLKPEL
jgi:hypothetical protein